MNILFSNLNGDNIVGIIYNEKLLFIQQIPPIFLQSQEIQKDNSKGKKNIGKKKREREREIRNIKICITHP